MTCLPKEKSDINSTQEELVALNGRGTLSLHNVFKNFLDDVLAIAGDTKQPLAGCCGSFKGHYLLILHYCPWYG